MPLADGSAAGPSKLDEEARYPAINQKKKTIVDQCPIKLM